MLANWSLWKRGVSENIEVMMARIFQILWKWYIHRFKNLNEFQTKNYEKNYLES